MAEYALIDSYLDLVTRRLEHRTDAADLRDELADHLFESTDRARARGLDPDTAQRSTLDRFGDPTLVAAMLAAVPTKGIDMIHALGRATGILSLVASALWVAVIFGGSFGLVNYLDRTWSTDEYFLQSIVQGLAVLVTGGAMIGLNLRVANRVDALTGVVIAAAILAFFFSFVLAWAFLAWGVYFAAALAVTIARSTREPGVNGFVTALLLVIVPVLLLIGSFAGLQALVSEASQPLNSIVERQLELAMFSGSGAISVLLAAGFAALGLRLRGATATREREPAAFA